MNHIGVKDQQRGRRERDAARRRRRLRPTVMALEGRELLSMLTVSNTNDSGTDSLRAAVNQANMDGGGDTIVFSSLFNTPQTITLTGGQLELTGTANPTTITGPAAGVTVSGNNASRVFQIDSGVTASISGLTITKGNSAYDGGGLLNLGTATLTNCTVSDNSAKYDGGGLANYGGTATLSLTNCTVSGNTAFFGGGLFNLGFTVTLTMANCTVSGNSAEVSGGLVNDGGTATLTNCTVSGNTGGPIGGLDVRAGTATLTNTIVAGNSGSDIIGSNYSGSSNLIGGNPLLAPLRDYGGPTQTMALLPGSKAINAGTSTGAPTTDQRGFSRGSSVDIGAFQDQGFTLTPVNTPQTAVVGTAFGSPLAVKVAVVDTTAPFINPVAGGVVTYTVNPVNGAGATLAVGTTTGTTVTAAIDVNGQAGIQPSVTATAGTTLGKYTVTASAAGAPQSATFNLTNAEAPSLVVTTALDVVNNTDGLTSLREAIAYANSLTVPASITFDPTVFGTTPRTITLTAGQLELSKTSGTETITGPAAGVTVSGGGSSRVFQVDPGVTASISGLTIADGKTSGYGGGLDNKGALTLTNCTVTGSHAAGGGGLYSDGGTATLTNCTVSDNFADIPGGSGSGHGGGLENIRSTATLTNCTISGNFADVPGGFSYGGGLYSYGGTTTLTNCTVSGNSALNVGGLYNQRGTATLTNTIVAGNTGRDVTGSISGSNNLIGGNPLLARLGDYGGPTQTMALLPGSPAIGAGDNAAVANPPFPSPPFTDQRGFSRISGGAVDIGAFEVQEPTLSPTTLPAGVSGAPYSQTITATQTVDAVGPFTFAIAAGTTLPSGLTLSSGGTLSGTPTAAGTFNFTVTATASTGYTGSQAYTLTVNPARPSISTTPQPASATVNSSIADQATVSGGFNPTGTVTFNLYNNPSGTGTPLFTDTETLSGGTATSNGYTATATGTDYWVATYNGDSNNNPVSSGTALEPVNITKATSSINTAQQPASATVNSSIADKATVSGGFNPTGTVTFNLYNNPNGTGTPLFTDTETLSGGTATSANYTTAAAGTDYWVATYNGDNNNNSVTSVANAEPVTITPATPSITTTQQPTNTAIVGTSIADTATVTGGYNPTRTVTFKLYNNPTATGTPLFTDTEPLSGGTATSANYTTAAAGTDYWIATYNGDNNNNSVSSGTAAEAVTVIGPSLIVLNPKASGALQVTGAGTINVAGPVYVDSSSSTALVASGSGKVIAAAGIQGGIHVVGDVSVSGGASLSPRPVTTGAAALPDPLLSLKPPVLQGPVNSVNLSGSSTKTINPGIYSSISVTGNAKLTLNPGVYVIAGGGFTVGNGAQVTDLGKGVLIYNAGSSYPNPGGSFGAINISGNSRVTLSADTTGINTGPAYAGIVLFQSRDNTQTISLGGSSVQTLQGVVYAPGAEVSVSGTDHLSETSLVANEVLVQGSGIVSS